MYSLKDTVAEVYLPLFPMKNAKEAIRATIQTGMNEKTQIGKTPEDFNLIQVASFDDNTGEITPLKNQVQYGSVKELLEQVKEQSEE